MAQRRPTLRYCITYQLPVSSPAPAPVSNPAPAPVSNPAPAPVPNPAPAPVYNSVPMQSITRGSCTDTSVAILLQHALAEEKHESQFSDVTVTAEGVEFKCHRLLLAATSGFFKSLFSSGMREDKEGRVTLHGVSSAVFADLMKWMYDGDPILSLENVFQVLPVVDQLDIQVLFTECKDILARNISLANCVRILNLSIKFNCVKLSTISLAFVSKNFDSFCSSGNSTELNTDAILSVIENPELVARSEDLIVEYILKWAHSEKKSMPDDVRGRYVSNDEEACPLQHFAELPFVEKSSTDIENENESMKSEASCLSKQTGSHDLVGSDDQIFANIKEKKDRNLREDCLPVLLEATRYLLISGNCVWQTMANDPLVQKSQRCRAVQEKILRYKTRLDCHQDACIPAAVHRMSEPLRDVVLACFESTFYCSVDFNKDWQSLEEPMEDTFLPNPSTLVYYDKNIYVQSDEKQLHVFSLTDKTWRTLTTATQTDIKTICMLPVGNELITIITPDNDRYSVECISLQEGRQWTAAGELFMRGMEIACVTNIGSKLIIFWKQAGKSCLQIECFDLRQRESFMVSHQLSQCAGLVAFKHEDEVFALQESGALWRISAQPEPPYITVSHELWLWTFQRAVMGAMLFDGELVVFETKSSYESAVKEGTGLDNVFSRVRSCSIPSDQTKLRFVHAVLPKTFIQ